MGTQVFDDINVILSSKEKPTLEDLRYLMKHNPELRNEDGVKLLESGTEDAGNLMHVVNYGNDKLRHEAVNMFIDTHAPAKNLWFGLIR
jgi:hypothetical protein